MSAPRPRREWVYGRGRARLVRPSSPAKVPVPRSAGEARAALAGGPVSERVAADVRRFRLGLLGAFLFVVLALLFGAGRMLGLAYGFVVCGLLLRFGWRTLRARGRS